MRLIPILLALTCSTSLLAEDHRAFDSVLRERVSGDGLVEYAAIRRHETAKLDAYLTSMSKVDIDKLPRDEQLAHYINLYNATMIRLVAEEFRDDGYSVAERDFAIFKVPFVRLATDETVSLDHLEHEIIRKQFKDPRIHVALVCAARSCPPLLKRAYRGEDLDKVLEENMKRFVNDASRNQIDDEKHELRLSKIFEWYADDFGGKDAVPGYIAKYAGKDVTGYRVSYLEYDWKLNAQPRA